MPPVTLIIMDPVVIPLHKGFVVTMEEMFKGGGEVIFTLVVFVQLLASITFIWKLVAGKPVNKFDN